MLSPIEVLREAIKAVPAVRYALGVGGILATLAIIRSFAIDARIAFVGTIVMFSMMGVLVVFARMASLHDLRMHLPAQVFAWFVLILFIAVSTSLFFSVFFQKPLDLESWITGEVVEPAETPVEKSCRRPEFGIEKWLKAEEIGQSSGWRDGGRSQQDWCNELIGDLIQRRSIGPEHQADVIEMSERDRKRWGHAEYNYFCKVRLSWQPLYVEMKSSKCDTGS